MPEITNEQELAKASESAGVLLQQIQNYLESQGRQYDDHAAAKVRFPRGFIRTAGRQRQRLEFVADQNLKANLAYTLILSDVVLWLKLRTDLWGTPKEMLVKLAVFLIGTIVESITKEYLTGICGKNYKGRIDYLADNGVIDDALRVELNWLWDTRNRMHLFQLDQREYENEYDDACQRRSIQCFRALIERLQRKGRLNAA